MHRASHFLAVSSLALLVACTGAVGDSENGGDASSDPDGSTTSDSNATTDASSSTDSSPSDTGSTTIDSGSPPPVDTGAGVDTSTGDPVADARVVCLDEINKYRATLSLPPYVGWSAIDTCVDGEAKKDSETGTAHSAFGSCGESAQNECPGWPGPPDSMIKSCLAMMWAEGPGSDFSTHGHYLNMSNASFTAVSCGFYQTPSGSWWAAQDFR